MIVFYVVVGLAVLAPIGELESFLARKAAAAGDQPNPPPFITAPSNGELIPS